MRVPIVFISYSHDSDEHRDRVLALSERLRKDGIETRLDQYLNGTPDETWPRWMLNRLDEADYVLVVATETYYRRFRGHEEPEKGLGVDWEGAVITQQIYEARSNTVKFVPVLFAPDQRQSIPEPLRGRTDYVLTSEASYQALYDFLLGQAGVEPGEIGKPRVKPRRNGKPLAFDGSSDENPREAAGAKEYLAAANISPSRLRHVAAKLFGREDDLACLDAAWSNNTTSVLTVVAWGGVGKTSLVATWAARLAVRNYDGARYYDWSFYSQGTKEQGEASSDQFIAHALEFFGDAEMADSPRSAWDKGARLAQLIAQQRTLLILDGLEPLQYPPGPLAGELRDPALTALLKGLAQRNSSGLCLITTRESVRDLEAFHDTTATEWRLDHLSIEAGVALLRSLGVYGTPAEFESLVGDVNGHALTLKLVGGYLARAHAGDIRRRDHIAFEEADAEIQGGHAFKAMKAYEHWLSEGQKQGERQLAILRLLGLFDRPADLQCLAALRDAPIIKGLTEPVVGITDSVWNVAITSLAEGGLIAIETDSPVDGSPPRTIDAHP
ncbi:MAG TPA: SEFIR domain-containing protein, partial [Longimicrobium sp.]|nr:SEFIR domain-containing protein [Longimicrobium sp.]